MSSNPYAKPSNPYAAYGAGSYYASTPATSAYPTAASTSAYGAPVAAAGPVLPAGYGGYPGVAAAGPAYPGAGSLDAQQASIYTPDAARSGKPVASVGNKGKGRTTVLRKGGGEVWEDQSLLEWDPCESGLAPLDVLPGA